MYTPSRTELFSTLPDPGMPWGRFLFSFATHFAALFALLTIGLMHPLGLDQPLRDYHFIRLVETPPVENQQPAPVRFLRSHLELAETPSLVLRPSEEPLPHAEKPVAVPPPQREIPARSGPRARGRCRRRRSRRPALQAGRRGDLPAFRLLRLRCLANLSKPTFFLPAVPQFRLSAACPVSYRPEDSETPMGFQATSSRIVR